MKKPLGVGALAALTLTAAACGGVPGTSPTEDGGASGGEETNRLVLAQSADIKTLDPQNASETPAERMNGNLYDRLFKRDENMEIVPSLVTDYEQPDDETWIFQIRDDVTFHNGDPLTAADVEFSTNRILGDDSLLEANWYTQVESVQATGEHEVTIQTDGAMPTLTTLLAKSGGDVLPSAHIEEVGIDAFIEDPIGSGPYEFVEWRRDDRVILEANKDYWGGEPVWDNVELRAIPENSTRVSELLTGGVDIITDVPPNEWERLEGEDGIGIQYGDTTRTMLLIVRMTEDYVTADPEIREAIDLAIDQAAITDSLFQGAATPTRTRAPVGVFGSNEELYDDYLYDPERAAEIVAKQDESPVLRMTAPRGRYPYDAEVAEMVSAMLEDAGFTVELKILEGGAFSDVYADYTNDELLMIALADGLLDASYSTTHYTQARAEGQTDYFDPKVEEMIAEANRTMDAEKRASIYQEVQAIVADQRPHIPLYVQPSAYGVREGLDFTPRLDDNFLFDAIAPAG